MPSDNNSTQENTSSEAKADSRESQKKDSPIAIPGAIVLAGLLIGAAILYSAKDTSTVTKPTIQSSAIEIADVTPNDHILGNANAKIVLIEHSDTECPYCKVFHAVMHKLVDTHGKNSELAWVYRHFPLYKGATDRPPLHPKAGKEAEATECVNELAGSAAFWTFVDKIYETTPSNNGLDLAVLPQLAEDAGVPRAAFTACLDSNKYPQFVESSYTASIKAGGTGTPYSVIILKKPLNEKGKQKMLEDAQKAFLTLNRNAYLPDDLFRFDESGTKIGFSGALPFEVMEAVIKALL